MINDMKPIKCRWNAKVKSPFINLMNFLLSFILYKDIKNLLAMKINQKRYLMHLHKQKIRHYLFTIFCNVNVSHKFLILLLFIGSHFKILYFGALNILKTSCQILLCSLSKQQQQTSCGNIFTQYLYLCKKEKSEFIQN